MEKKLIDLKDRLREVADIESAGSVLYWDQATYMPPGGAASRGRQMATLGKIGHEKATDPALGHLLEGLKAWAEGPGANHADGRLIKVAARDFDRASRIPASFVAEFSEHASKTYEAWTRARPANDFASLRPLLEKSLEYSLKQASYFKEFSHPLDALMDGAEPGMRVDFVKPLFKELRQELVGILKEVRSHGEVDDSVLKGVFPEAKQLDFGVRVAKDFGYDFTRGRQDKTHHPFMIKFGSGDVRILTRVRENDMTDAFFSTIHEVGHALYEQGIDASWDATPCNTGTSVGVHESQSRLWENMVGRSYAFWTHYYPALQAEFPDAFGKLPLEKFYRAINKVSSSLIRVDADELTYNLHVLVRFELEAEMLEGKLAVKDLPAAWHAKYQEYLGVRAPDDRDGCMQDVHWYGGTIGGYFQGYTVGNILAAQFFDAALKSKPSIAQDIGAGRFAPLLGWLREKIHQPGRSKGANEIIRGATGEDLSLKPYLSYLRGKYLAKPYLV